jgi:hypothetical protein
VDRDNVIIGGEDHRAGTRRAWVGSSRAVSEDVANIRRETAKVAGNYTPSCSFLRRGARGGAKVSAAGDLVPARNKVGREGDREEIGVYLRDAEKSVFNNPLDPAFRRSLAA